ncbi:glycosyltransferase family 2 protein [Acidihalobacter prosperus]|uniref:N-acetylglucosaminyltransferase n=1 Tax=Acidihalobacter prosperus TaxID=160660 RepID=A0A1A6C2S1_9GAMM|nr:glycosyltransferase family 2 protein [Acidihalobacter prosperus]OBS08867.1 hypothetical protein Thpro_023117 [Acidihalobacter prosperus]
MSLMPTPELPEPLFPAADPAQRRRLQEFLLAGLVLALLAGIAYTLMHPMARSLAYHEWLQPLAYALLVWAGLELVLLLLKTLLWFHYRPVPSAALEAAPALTVIIPAYNEGAMVEQSIDSVARAHYPAELLEILVVDDGSRDDTWDYIEQAAARHPGVVTTVRFPENRGKRAALLEGFRRARGEVVVTIDSDSVIDAGTLLALVAPFADERVGAVAGKVVVHNRHEGTIPRMLQVAYILSFDYLRAAQSGYRTVYCCPGALAAYRTSAVREVLDAWMNQTFWGAACTYGEDRAMTNYLLARGYDTLYQNTAVVRTMVPTTYRRLCKMFLRWDRSFIREEIRLAGIVWRRPPVARLLTVFDRVITDVRFPLRYLGTGLAGLMVMDEPAALGSLLLGSTLFSTLYALYYLRSERSWNVLFGVAYSYYSALALWWILPYAALTLRAKSWMTR